MANNSLYPASSPYFATGVVNSRFLDNLRPDMLAYDLYSNSKLWWVFASRNPNTLADPFFDFTAGTSIYLPDAATLKQVLGL